MSKLRKGLKPVLTFDDAAQIQVGNKEAHAAGPSMLTILRGVKMAICINNQTVGNLKKYLSNFPDDAKVVIWHDYKMFDMQIACNFKHQFAEKKAIVLLGDFLEKA